MYEKEQRSTGSSLSRGNDVSPPLSPSTPTLVGQIQNIMATLFDASAQQDEILSRFHGPSPTDPDNSKDGSPPPIDVLLSRLDNLANTVNKQAVMIRQRIGG